MDRFLCLLGRHRWSSVQPRLLRPENWLLDLVVCLRTGCDACLIRRHTDMDMLKAVQRETRVVDWIARVFAALALLILAMLLCSCAFLIRNSECADCSKSEACIPAQGRHYMCVDRGAPPPTLLPTYSLADCQ